MTSIVVFPEWRAAVPVNTPLPTAAGCPWTWTVALIGVTVPRIVTLLAAITLPLVGAVTTTETAPEPTVLVVVEVVEPQPAIAAASTAMTPSANSLMRLGSPQVPAWRDPTRDANRNVS
jgi:hypothetical protein